MTDSLNWNEINKILCYGRYCCHLSEQCPYIYLNNESSVLYYCVCVYFVFPCFLAFFFLFVFFYGFGLFINLFFVCFFRGRCNFTLLVSRRHRYNSLFSFFLFFSVCLFVYLFIFLGGGVTLLIFFYLM